MTLSDASARRTGQTSRPGAKRLALASVRVRGSRASIRSGGAVPPCVVALALALLPLTAHADPPRCIAEDDSQGRCMTAASIRMCDADQAQLPHVLAELRVADQRLVVAFGDAAVLSRALAVQSALVVDLRAAVVSARPWLSGWAWTAIGAGLGVLGTLLVALSL